MALYDNRYGTAGSIYGDVSGVPAQAQERKMLAQRLLSNYGEMPQGQMISGHYVAPSWTQQLAAAIKGPLARAEINAANKELKDYGEKKRQDIAAILSGQAPQQVTTSQQEQYLPAYEPSQMDRFGSPTAPREMQTRTVESSRTETPEEVQARLRPLIYQAASQYGNDPALQLALGDLNYQRQRGDTRADLQEGRQYQEGREAVKRTQQLEDVAANQEFQRIMMKEQQGFQTTQQERQFAQQYKMMNAQQGFQANQAQLGREFQAGQNDLSRQQALQLAQTKAATTQQPKLTEDMRSTGQYAQRMQAAENLMAGNNSQKPGVLEIGAGVLGETSANLARSPERQTALQAQRDWVRAKLRKESGAAIGKDEMDKEISTYFPQIGDSPEVIAQKTASRNQAMQGMIQSAGAAYNPPLAPQSSTPIKKYNPQTGRIE